MEWSMLQKIYQLLLLLLGRPQSGIIWFLTKPLIGDGWPILNATLLPFLPISGWCLPWECMDIVTLHDLHLISIYAQLIDSQPSDFHGLTWGSFTCISLPFETQGVFYTSQVGPPFISLIRRACETRGSRFDSPHYTRAWIRSLDHMILSGWWRHNYLKERCTLCTEPLSPTYLETWYYNNKLLINLPMNRP